MSDLIISGMGNVNGGIYNNITIAGMGKITGDIEGDHLNISGKGTVDGSVKVSALVVSGDGSVKGSVESRNISSSGNFKITGSAKTEELTCSGRCRVDESLKTHRLDSSGYLSVGGEVEADEFHSNGSFSIEGLLNASRIQIQIDGFCYAKEIGGEEIGIRLKKLQSMNFLLKPVYSLFLGRNRELNKLKSELIEGTDIIIEHTHAAIIRGHKIKIGPGCLVDRVEYTDSLEVDADSRVNHKVKI